MFKIWWKNIIIFEKKIRIWLKSSRIIIIYNKVDKFNYASKR